MKTRFIFLVLLIVCFACGINNKPVSDAQKEKIKGEVKGVVNKFLKGAEEANFEMAISPWLDSPDFVYIYNGVCFDYKGIVDAMKPVFSTQINQKVTLKDEKYAILDKSTVIYTSNCTFLENYKDGHAVLEDPAVIQITFRKINDKWVAICGLESSVRQNATNSETSKELSQIELMKKFAGTWKSEAGKDTSFIWEGKSYGEGLDVNVRFETKGKIINEGKAVLAYDKNSDKYIQARIMKTSGSILAAMWFTSKNTCEGVLYNDMSNPENAKMKAIFEFISPTKFTQTDQVPNKPDEVSTFTLLSK